MSDALHPTPEEALRMRAEAMIVQYLDCGVWLSADAHGRVLRGISFDGDYDPAREAELNQQLRDEPELGRMVVDLVREKFAKLWSER